LNKNVFVLYTESNEGSTIVSYSPIETLIGLWYIYLYCIVFKWSNY